MKFSFIMTFFLSFVVAAYVIKPKFCIDCAHFIPDNGGNAEFGKCKIFSFVEKDKYLLTGIKKDLLTDYTYCSTAREINWLCGNNGKKYISKN